MDSGYYAACTALVTQSQALELVANNLANSSTSGYRSQQSIFRSVLAETPGMPLSPLNFAINQYGVMEGTRLDLRQGSLQPTSNPLDLAIEGSGFFVVQTAAGRFFTRDGGFHVANGQLVTAAGDAVMGDEGALRLIDGQVSIGPDGTVSVNGALAGKLRVVDFPEGTPLESEGQTYYSAPKGVEKAATEFSVRQGVLESSNVNPIAATVELITVQRQFDLMRRALSIFDSQFNRTAAETLPHFP